MVPSAGGDDAKTQRTLKCRHALFFNVCRVKSDFTDFTAPPSA